MSRNLMILFLLVAVVCATAMSNPPIKQKKMPMTKCGKNEVYSKCNAKCQPTCDKLKPICPKKCVSGCVCKDGLVKNLKTNQCIRRCECDC